MKISSFLYAAGIVLAIAISVGGILLHIPIWITVIAPVIVITALTILAENLKKKSAFADDSRLSSLIYEAILLKTKKGDTEEIEKKLSAACEGHPEAWKGYRVLGELFLVRENRSKAKGYFQKAEKSFPAKGPSSDRCGIWNNIGAIALEAGRGDEALAYYLKAAEAEPFYFRGPGLMYEFGWGVPEDPVGAEWMFLKAVKSGNGEAIANLYELLWRNEKDIPRNLWQGYSDYMRNCHCGRTPVVGAASLRNSAQMGYAPAQFELGTLFQNGVLGEDVPKRRREAFKWLRASADQGFLPALHNLGFLVQQCIFHPEKGDIYQPRVKGSLLYDKETVKYCAQEGHKLILRAAEGGFPPAQHSIGLRYILGGQALTGEEYRDVFEKDDAKARQWLEKAARQGFKPARDDLKKYFGVTL